MANVTAMRAVAQPSRTPLGDFNRSRWQWLDAVEEDPELNPTAKVLASVLARRCADHITGDCFPRNELLMRLMGGKSVDTVQRAFRALEARGWLRRGEARGRGSKAVVTFLMTAKVIPLKAADSAQGDAKDAPRAAKTPQECAPKRAANMQLQDEKRAADMQQKHRKYAASRIYPKYNQKEHATETDVSARPAPHHHAVAYHGTDRLLAWNEWLTKRGYPSLEAMGDKASDTRGTGFDTPFSYPLTNEEHNRISNGLAKKWADWLLAKHEARHDH